MSPPRPRFRGPLFLVGLPRSGTKLLRGLLSQNPEIRLPPIETELLPYWARRWTRWGDLSQRQAFHDFYAEVIGLPYFTYLSGRVISEATWYAHAAPYTLASVFEALVRHDLGLPADSDLIWGDKSPSYVRHLPLIKSLYPQARVIHILRDVRDYALSIQKAWRKNPLRAAQRWVDGIGAARRDAASFAEDYLEVRYEDLLDAPEAVLRRCCAFVERPYDPAMMRLSKSEEKRGDAKGALDLKRDNQQKWREQMSPALRAQIEAISADVLRSAGYPVEHTGPVVRVPPAKMLALQGIDGLGLVRAEVQQRGVLGAVRYRWDTYRVSGNRRRNKSF